MAEKSIRISILLSGEENEVDNAAKALVSTLNQHNVSYALDRSRAEAGDISFSGRLVQPGERVHPRT